MSGASVAFSAEEMAQMQETQRKNAEVAKRILAMSAPKLDPVIIEIRNRTDISVEEKDKLCTQFIKSKLNESVPSAPVPTFRKLADKIGILQTPAQKRAEDDQRAKEARMNVQVQTILPDGMKKPRLPSMKGSSKMAKKEKTLDLSNGFLEISENVISSPRAKNAPKSSGKFIFTLYKIDNSEAVNTADKGQEALPKIKEALLSGGYVRAKLSVGVCLTLLKWVNPANHAEGKFCYTRKWYADSETARLAGIKAMKEGIGNKTIPCKNCQGLGRIAKYQNGGYPPCNVCKGNGKSEVGDKTAINSFQVSDVLTRENVVSFERALSVDPIIPSRRAGSICAVKKINPEWKVKAKTTQVTFSGG